MKKNILTYLFFVAYMCVSTTVWAVNDYYECLNDMGGSSHKVLAGSFGNSCDTLAGPGCGTFQGTYGWGYPTLDSHGNQNGLSQPGSTLRDGYAYQSMIMANSVRLEYPPTITYSDYIYQQCRSQKPVTANRFILTLSDQDPFNPQYTVQLDETDREAYDVGGFLYLAGLPDPPCNQDYVDEGAGGPLDITYDNICDAGSGVANTFTSGAWWNNASQTFDMSEIRQWTDGNAGYGSKDLYAFRICLRSVPPGAAFNPNDGDNINLVPDPDPANEITLGVPPDPNSPPSVFASLYAFSNGQYVNASNRTKICAYNVQIKPDCNDPATQTAFSITATLVGGMFGGAIGAAILGSFAQQICSLIAGSGPCLSPEVSWTSAFIGCVDAPLPPGPPILNATLPIIVQAVIDSQMIYPPQVPVSTAGQKAPASLAIPAADVGKSPQQLVAERIPNSLTMGSTFDQPVVQIVTGAASETLFPATFTGDDANIYNVLKLRYIFPGDKEIIDSLQPCGSISTPYINARFCTYYDNTKPDRICACIQNNADFSDCYDPTCTNADRTTCSITSMTIGCAVRPTPNLSSIQYKATQSTVSQPQVKVTANQTGTNRPNATYPSITLGFQAWREKNTTNRVVNVAGTWYRSKDGTTLSDPTNVELYLLNSPVGSNISNNNIPEFDFAGQTNCQIVVDNNGNIINSNYYAPDQNTTSCKYTANVSRYFYGLNFQTIVPAYDDQNHVLQTQIITPNQVVVPPTILQDSSCHQSANMCVKSYITSANFQSCWGADWSNLNGAAGTVTTGILMQYPILSLSAQPPSPDARYFSGICGAQVGQMVQTCGRDAQGNILSGAPPGFPHTPPTIADINFVVSNSDAEALSAWCPGLLDEPSFEDMDISRICLTYPAVQWTALNQEVMANSYNPDLTQRTCFKMTNKVCRGYLTPMGGDIAATPPSPSDTLPDNSDWTSWPRPPQATSPNNPVSGTCGAGYGVANFNQLEQNPANFLTFSRHPGAFEKTGYTLEGQVAFCNSFPSLQIPSVSATLYGPCGASETFSFTIGAPAGATNPLNETTLNNDIASFTSTYGAGCTPTADEITAFKLAAYGEAASTLGIDISSYTIAINNAQNAINDGFQVSFVYSPNATLTCQSYNGCTSGTFSVCTNQNQEGPCGTGGDNNCNSYQSFPCQMNVSYTQPFSQQFTFNFANLTNEINADVSTATSQLSGYYYPPAQSYTINYNAGPQESCPAVCGPAGYGCCCYYDAWSSTDYENYYCPYNFNQSDPTGVANAITTFKNTVNSQSQTQQNNLTTAQDSLLSGVDTLVQNAATTIQNQCNLYYTAYSYGVYSVSQQEMCNAVLAALPTTTLAACKAIPVKQQPICQKLVSGGGVSQALCNNISTSTTLTTAQISALQAVCNPLVNYTTATCNAISDPSTPYFTIGDGLVSSNSITTNVISDLNLYAQTTQSITLADGSVIQGSMANIAATPTSNTPSAQATAASQSPYALYLASRIITANSVTLDGVTINLLPTQTTPSRVCDYSLNHRGCYPGACTNTCIQIPGCPAINKVSDFTGYATWPAAPTSTGTVTVQGTCTIPQPPGVTTPRTPLYRTCNIINYTGVDGNSYQYSYWSPINQSDPGTAACLAASVNYW